MLKVIIMAILIAFCSCTQRKNSNVILSNDSSADSVSQILNFSTIVAYRNQNKLWELNADEILQMTQNKGIKANPVRLTMFDDSSKITAVLTADSGVSNDRTDSIFVWGNVKINAQSGEKLLAQTLEWNKREKILISVDFVELRSQDGEIMRGRGFRAAENFEWWDFKNEVSGNFPSIYAELEKDD